MLKTIKTIGKRFLCRLLEAQVRRLRASRRFTLIAVAGSIGKTSTKRAIVTLLEESHSVRSQAGNYNDRLTVPLVVFGHVEPSIFNIVSWVRILIRNERQLRQSFPYDYVVVELGTDGPGQIEEFAYLNPEVAVVTAVADEHMEYFQTIDAVATEELAVTKFSQKVIANLDLIDATYLGDKQVIGYGTHQAAVYRIAETHMHGIEGQSVSMAYQGQTKVAQTTLLGVQGASTVVAAVAAASEAGLQFEEAVQATAAIRAVAGRLQLLKGIKDSVLIDDSYNASPTAVTAALDVLYTMSAPQRIAVLGDMNELGETSVAAHELIGAYCKPDLLDLVVTIGPMSKAHLAPAAEAVGCTVKSFDSPYAAGHYLAEVLQPQAIVLYKGSQNRVFSEEAIKALLADPADVSKLVRQSDSWLTVKRRQFDDAEPS